MKRPCTLLLLLMLMGMLMSACSQPNRNTEDIPPAENTSAGDNDNSTTDSKDQIEDTDPTEEPISISHLTVELVVEWGDAERFLSQLDSLSTLLQQSLTRQNCTVDDITITISTAGGPTGDALTTGGVDIAFLPAEDYITREDSLRAVLTTDEEICSIVAATSSARQDLNEAFCQALEQALLETEEGLRFLDTYQPDIICIPASETALQAVRDRMAEQEEEHGGH